MFAQLLIGEQYKSTYTRASILLLVSILTVAEKMRVNKDKYLPHVGITISTFSTALISAVDIGKSPGGIEPPSSH